MARGDSSLIVQAATERAFDFTAGSPYDPRYKLRLKLVLECLDRKNQARLTELDCKLNMLMVLQHTMARAKDINNDRVINNRERLKKLLNYSYKLSTIDDASDKFGAYKVLKEFYERTFGSKDNQRTSH